MSRKSLCLNLVGLTGALNVMIVILVRVRWEALSILGLSGTGLVDRSIVCLADYFRGGLLIARSDKHLLRYRFTTHLLMNVSLVVATTTKLTVVISKSIILSFYSNGCTSSNLAQIQMLLILSILVT